MADEWQKAPFEKLLIEPVRNGIYKTKEFHGRGAKIVNMGELFSYPRLRNVPMKRVELNESEASRFLLTKGDLIFARRSLTAEGAGKCSVVLELDEATTFESSIIRARPNPEKADHLYLYYFFNSSSGFHSLDTIRRQVAVAGITGGDLAKLEIPIPPLHVQRAIAYILGTLDDKIELNRRRNQTLEAMARALFKDWFVDFGPVRAKMEGREPYLPADLWQLFPDHLDNEDKPEGWEIGTLADFTNLNPESWSKKNTPETIDYIDLANTKNGTIESSYRLSWSDAPSRAQRILRTGDTIVGTVRPGNGSYSLISDGGLTGSTGFAVLRPKHSFYREFVYLAATSVESIKRLAHIADGAAYPAVRPDAVSALPVAKPDRESVELIIRAFSKFSNRWVDAIELNKIESRTLAALRESLLPRLLSGQIRVTNSLEGCRQ